MDSKKLIEEGKRLYPDIEKWFPGFSWDGLEARISDGTMSGQKQFSLRFSYRDDIYYASLAEAIFAIDSLAWVNLPLSLHFDGRILAEGKALTALLPSKIAGVSA